MHLRAMIKTKLDRVVGEVECKIGCEDLSSRWHTPQGDDQRLGRLRPSTRVVHCEFA